MSEIGEKDPLPRLDECELRDGNLMALEGSFLVERAVDRGITIKKLLCVPSRLPWAESLLGSEGSGQIISLPERDISLISGYSFHRGVFALAQRPEPPSLSSLVDFLAGVAEGEQSERHSTILVLPEILDPENLGSTFRSAAALGCEALLLGPKGPDPLSRRVLRVSMGAALGLPWARMEGPEDLGLFARSGYELAAAVLDQKALELGSFRRPGRLALVLGNEAFGLSASWLERCGIRLTLPMRGGMDSLNLAVAAALFLYSLRS